MAAVAKLDQCITKVVVKLWRYCVTIRYNFLFVFRRGYVKMGKDVAL